MNLELIKSEIRDVPNFPKEGIIFKDITPLLQNGECFASVTNDIAARYKDKKIDVVVGIEARGFIFGAPVANALRCGFVPVRKKGKLPYKTKSITYDLEYGTDTLEIHEDAFKSGKNVLILDDVLATGGTVKAVSDMVREMGGNIVGTEFLIELSFLNGRDKLGNQPINAIINY